MSDASKCRPKPKEPMIKGVLVATFDNLTMRVDYKSYSVGGATGEMLDMTNWFVCALPQSLAPGLDGARIFRTGIFRPDGLSLGAFTRLFHLENPDVVGNKRARWFAYLKAARDGCLLERPATRALWKPHKEYQPQMPDRL